MSGQALTRMTNDLRGLLEGQTVPKDVIEYLKTVGCYDIGLFSDRIDAKNVDDSIQLHILDQCGEESKKQRRAFATVKHAWRIAFAQSERRMSRQGDGLNGENLDERLPKATCDHLDAAFTQHYEFQLQPSEVATDAQLGRFNRECLKKLPTM